MKIKTLILFAAATLVFSSVAPGHVENYLLPEGCGSCHVGHGMSNEPMLSASQEDFCYQCHGSEDKKSTMISDGKLSPAASLADIEQEFDKPYRHPVEEDFGHSPIEKLPKFDGSTITHAECMDCHNPHQRMTQKVDGLDKVSGFSISGQYLESATQEYEICLKCHSESGARRETTKDIRQQFAHGMRSMHPVTKPSAGTRQVSLKPSLTVGSVMKCTDCHSNDDLDGPRGPHGSIYPYLLNGYYDTDPRADESPQAYQFCYGCHDRSSILDNESFSLHEEHIIGDPLRGISGTSCFTCHASHSSERNPYLIKFNPEVVSGTAIGNRIEFLSIGEHSGRCYLTCHGHEHDAAEY
jgi:predicted CXXCH cytochrome family protein